MSMQRSHEKVKEIKKSKFRVFIAEKILAHICQNCRFANNEQGKYIYHWYKPGIEYHLIDDKIVRDPQKKGYWHVFCVKKKKYMAWDSWKICFKISGEIKNGNTTKT